MSDVISKKKRSELMARVRGCGNKSTEMRIAKLMRTVGCRGWRRRFLLFGNPDFVFRDQRLALFIDGCFWHGCRDHCRMPSSNVAYWKRKIARNQNRDRLVLRTLQKRSWRVLRIWEHELRNPERVMDRVLRALKSSRNPFPNRASASKSLRPPRCGTT